MKKAILLLTLTATIAACDQTPDIDDTWTVTTQQLCNPDPDTCPGGHALTPAKFTVGDLRHWGRSRGFYVAPTAVASCNAISCSASVGTGTQQFNTTCFDQDEDSTGWECHDVPPLEYVPPSE